ncbi:FAD-dependent oxidoreductase [Curvivirga sp.]|uniref:FAD-dependent oxidoreductase n=1 Tax=Curvivirga sp. TaxID=2856848 RepID=UPI003B5C92D5
MNSLLESFQLKHLTIRNRILSTAHAPSFQENGHPRDRYRLYHEEKARGGVGLTMIGGSTNIAPDSPSVFGQLYAGDDSIIPWFQKLTHGVKSHGAAIMCQITHMGRRTAWDDGYWLPVQGPSVVRERAHRSTPKAMEIEDVDRIISNFAEAAIRCQQGGFDGIELLSHSHLLGQFLSPLINQRDDDYGGSLENRMRLTFRVLEAVREAVGSDFIVGMRITGDELTEGGLEADECIEIAQKLADTQQVDFLNILAGAPYDDLGLAGWVAPMGVPSAPHLNIAGAIRKTVDIPVFHAGGIADIATAKHAIQEGMVDLVGMTRAQMADPHLVRKLAEGKEDQIRPCVGLGYCVDRVNQGKQAVCGHNAATGREGSLPHIIEPSNEKKKVIVVGGGPAGLEAARVAAERGHDVVLFEAGDQLGGQLSLAAKGKTRRQIWGIADWLINEVGRLKVEIRTNVYAEASDIIAENPDYVIVATGGWPDLPNIAGQKFINSSWDILGGETRVEGKVLLYDEIGDHPATVCADLLAQNGCEVIIVTPDRAIAHDLGPTNSAVALRDLFAQNIQAECFYEMISVTEENQKKQVTLRHVLTGQIKIQLVDHVMIENGTKPMDMLYFDLKAQSKNMGQLDHQAILNADFPFMERNQDGDFFLARIGDAIASRNIHAAIYDAMRVCVTI